jgi:hypothetical protein
VTSKIQEYISRNRRWVALGIALALGYTVGKDMTLRDNQRDATQAFREGS